MKGAMPDREGWGTIGRIAWRITDHALAEFTRPYTCGIPVYRYLKEELAKGGADSKEKKDRKQEAAGKEEESDNKEEKDQKQEAAGTMKTKEEDQGGSRKARGRL
uniref:Uncharacterized protein n=1 Tax=Ananas comosus var. bracteatus TaxID=296719 RepID=A0A6V7NLU2_ANACO|nr:unnamed protein product [Ananas comosus var. bracteatus]